MLRNLSIAALFFILVSFFSTPTYADSGEFSWHSMYTKYEQNLWDIWGTSSSDVFVVGEGVIIHYNGTNWTTMVNNSNYNFRAIWGLSTSNVFAVGAQGLILHYDGTSWQSMNSGVAEYLFDVWGTSASDVFTIGESGKILHYDGSAWNVTETNIAYSLQAIWGNSSSNYFIVGINYVNDRSLILHYNGTSWQTVDSGTWKNLYAVWGTASNNIFAVGSIGTVLHYDGNSWTPITIDSGLNNMLTGIWGTSSSDFFVVSQGISHYNGSTWNTVSGSGIMAFCKILGFATGEIFTVGYGGRIAYYGNKQLPVFKVTPLRDQFYRNSVTDFDAPVGESVMHVAFDYQIDPLVTMNNTDITLTHSNNAFTVYQFLTPATGGSPMFTFSPTQSGLTTDNITLSCSYGSITFHLVGNGVPVENPESLIIDLPTATEARRLIYDETRNYLYITDANNNRIIVLSLQEKDIVTTIPVGFEPVDGALSKDRQHLYVTNAGESSISDIDLNILVEVNRFLIPSIGPSLYSEPGYVPYNITMLSNTVALIGSRPPGLAGGGPVYQVDFTAKSLTIRKDLGSGRCPVVRSSDDFSTTVILPEPAGTPGKIVRYEPATNSITSSSYNRIEREVITNKDGTVIVTTNHDNYAIISNLRITDHNLNLIKEIDLLAGQPGGLVFHPGGQYIYSFGAYYPIFPLALEETSINSKMLVRELRFPIPQDYHPINQPKVSVISSDGTWLYAILSKTGDESSSKILALKINRNLTNIAINPANVTATIGSYNQFTAIGTYSDGSTANITSAVTWTSSDPTKTNIKPHTGLAHILTEGSAIITATLGSVSNNAVISTLPAAQLSFTTQPNVGYTAGVNFSSQLVVTVQDIYGNTVNTYNSPVSLDITTGSGTNGAVLSGTTALDAVNGLATFSGLSINLAGNGYTLTATSGTLAPAISQVFNVVHLGDANGDGVVNMGDATKVMRIILGLDTATLGADANGDGIINMGDVTKIMRIILGI
jgi:hypothetical protein